jgi:OmpR-family two-component system manganese-sensing sensor histidine kinase
VDDLLFLTRSDSGIVQSNYQDLPLDALLIGVIEEQRAITQQKNIYLSLHIVEPTAQYKFTLPMEEYFTVAGDWDHLARLFTNLISNALEHADFDSVSPPKEASVEVELQLIGKPHNPNLEVKVKDTGKGIPPEVLPYIFDRFYRVQPSHGSSENSHSSGAGLGLAIVKAIIDNHQGKITVESVVNQGTTFQVILPKLLPFPKNHGEVGNSKIQEQSKQQTER